MTSKGDVFFLEGVDNAGNITPPRYHGNQSHSTPIQNGSHDKQQQNSSEIKKRSHRRVLSGSKKELEDTNGAVSNGDQPNAHSVTFNDIPTGVSRNVTIHVDPLRHNYGRRATLCETLFGIIPGLFSTKSIDVNSSKRDRRIMVQGLLPGGEGIKSGIKIGRCTNLLKSVQYLY